ncbi:MAG: hypothetical protein PVSMB9_10530 [Candidatus Dormibacteria bacterium]
MIRIALKAGRRYGLVSASFWATFFQYRRYRIRRVWPALLGAAGLLLALSGAVSLFEWVLVYYAHRLGHPVSPIRP